LRWAADSLSRRTHPGDRDDPTKKTRRFPNLNPRKRNRSIAKNLVNNGNPRQTGPGLRVNPISTWDQVEAGLTGNPHRTGPGLRVTPAVTWDKAGADLITTGSPHRTGLGLRVNLIGTWDQAEADLTITGNPRQTGPGIRVTPTVTWDRAPIDLTTAGNPRQTKPGLRVTLIATWDQAQIEMHTTGDRSRIVPGLTVTPIITWEQALIDLTTAGNPRQTGPGLRVTLTVIWEQVPIDLTTTGNPGQTMPGLRVTPTVTWDRAGADLTTTGNLRRTGLGLRDNLTVTWDRALADLKRRWDPANRARITFTVIRGKISTHVGTTNHSHPAICNCQDRSVSVDLSIALMVLRNHGGRRTLVAEDSVQVRILDQATSAEGMVRKWGNSVGLGQNKALQILPARTARCRGITSTVRAPAGGLRLSAMDTRWGENRNDIMMITPPGILWQKVINMIPNRAMIVATGRGLTSTSQVPITRIRLKSQLRSAIPVIHPR